MDTTNKLICRKCGGNHLTIKCGKEIKKEDKYEKYEKKEDKYEKKDNKNYIGKTFKTNENFKNFRKQYKIKMTSLPDDITEEELQELLYDWGHVLHINLKRYKDSTLAYIEFKYEEEVDYLIKALDNTPFDHNIIHIEKLEN
jgi:RNA recognition motif-containing protein